MPKKESFRVFVSKDYLKFSAAHFIAYDGFRERLHGHNYRVSVEVDGELGDNGYVVDFGVVKKLAREVCQILDERLIVPARSDCVSVIEDGDQIVLCSQSGRFSIPRGDCVLLPLVHSSAEELARYIAGEIEDRLRATGAGRLAAVEVGVEETFGQAAYYRIEP